MPNLPELRGKVKIEFSDVLEATAKAKLLGDVLKKELGTGNLKQTEVALTGLGAAIANIPLFGGPATKAMSSLSAESFTAIPLIGNLASSLASIPYVGVPAIAVLLAISAALIGVSSSLVVLSTGAIAILTAVAAGFTAVGLAAGLALGPIAALGAGIVALGVGSLGDQAAALTELQAAQDAYNATQGITISQATLAVRAHERLIAAQNAYNKAVAEANSPLGRFKQGIIDLASGLRDKTLPIAQQIATWAIGFLPVVQRLGEGLITWFGARVPAVLSLAGQAMSALETGTRQLGGVLGGFIDQVIVRMPSLGPILQQGFKGGLDAVKGLLDNLLKFVDWFVKNWPTIQPIAKEVMDAVGNAIQGLAREGKKLVDYFVQNWPEIRHTIEDLMPAISLLGDAVRIVGAAFVIMMKSTEDVVYRLGQIRDALYGVASAASAVSSAAHNTPVVGGVLDILGFQSGGIAAPGSLFISGESGPELGYALPGGGVLIQPHSSADQSRHVTNNLTLHGAGAVNDPEGVRRMLLRMERLGAAG